ncbi:AraC family ligand binding domain-containing protein [Vibrio mexicanus]|uniref:AraC family ligand binding domain-containing protein n=1 Tax=Vibrio mexicanus TaxID=1004326 RepID=UPI003B508F8A
MPWIEIRTALNSAACYDSHSHDEVSFGIINYGSAKYRNQRNQHLIGQGDVVTINLGMYTRAIPIKGSGRILCCLLMRSN